MIKLGVQSAPWYSDQDPDSSIRFVKESGFDAIDFNIDVHLPGDKIKTAEFTPFFDQSIEELCEFYRPLKEALEKYGVSISQMHAPFPVWSKELPAVNDYVTVAIEKICAVCAYLGCPAIVVHSITRSDKAAEIETNLGIYRRLMPAAKKYGVKICLENLFGSFKGRIIEGSCSNVEEACWYIDTLNTEAGEDVFGFCLDVGHANILGRNLRQYIQKLGKRLTVLHIHDNDGNSDLHMMPYTYTKNWGKDQICDWDGFLEGLKDIGYDGTLSFETFRVLGAFPHDVWPETMKLMSSIARYFKKRIEE